MEKQKNMTFLIKGMERKGITNRRSQIKERWKNLSNPNISYQTEHEEMRTT